MLRLDTMPRSFGTAPQDGGTQESLATKARAEAISTLDVATKESLVEVENWINIVNNAIDGDDGLEDAINNNYPFGNGVDNNNEGSVGVIIWCTDDVFAANGTWMVLLSTFDNLPTPLLDNLPPSSARLRRGHAVELRRICFGKSRGV